MDGENLQNSDANRAMKPSDAVARHLWAPSIGLPKKMAALCRDAATTGGFMGSLYFLGHHWNHEPTLPPRRALLHSGVHRLLVGVQG